MLDGWLQKGTIPRDVLKNRAVSLPQPSAAASAAPAPAGGWNLQNLRFLPRAVSLGVLRPCGHPPRGHALWSPSARPRPVVTLCASSSAWSPSARLRPALVTRGFTFTHSLTRYILNWSRPGDLSCAGRGAQGHVTWDTNVTSGQDDGLHQ